MKNSKIVVKYDVWLARLSCAKRQKCVTMTTPMIHKIHLDVQFVKKLWKMVNVPVHKNIVEAFLVENMVSFYWYNKQKKIPNINTILDNFYFENGNYNHLFYYKNVSLQGYMGKDQGTAFIENVIL